MERAVETDSRIDFVQLGNYLRIEREARSMSLDELSRTTRIPRQRLEALERGALGELPARVYVRGFLKSCARELGLAATELLHRFDQAARAADVELAERELAQPRRVTPALREVVTPQRVGVAIGITVVALVAATTLGRSRRPDASAPGQKSVEQRDAGDGYGYRGHRRS